MKETLLSTILPMSEQAPFAIPSESDEWYQHTFRYEGRPESVPNSMKAIVVMAHPDDESEMAGGLIATLADKGYQVTIVQMTDGSKGGDSRKPMSEQELVKLRLEESYKAATILGAHRLINLGATDGELPMDPADDPKLVEKLVKIMREDGGSLYVTHPLMYNPTTYDYHADHRNTTHFVERAIQLARNGNHALELGQPLNDVPTLLYVDPQNLRSGITLPKDSSKWAAPVDFLLDTTKVIARKKEAFSSHESQVNNVPDGLKVGYVEQRLRQDKFRAHQMTAVVPYFLRRKRKLFAEGFTVHLAHGFNTDLSGIFSNREMVAPHIGYRRRHLPHFGK